MTLDTANRAYALTGLGLGVLLFVGVGLYEHFTPEAAAGGLGLIIQIVGLLVTIGSAYLVWKQGQPESPVNPFQWAPLHEKMEASDFLNWRSRLSEKMVGRHKEIGELLRWRGRAAESKSVS